MSELLHRHLSDGKEYRQLIPVVSCENVGTGFGDTFFSIHEIEEMVKLYHFQMKDVATKLQQNCNSVAEVVAAVKDFCFNHFQYLADAETQQLRSPACSWKVREIGIDCKSYTIVASSILTCLGINHNIRKIKQRGNSSMTTKERNDYESGFSHVYVIVPIDQANGDINQGYYTIDGTLYTDDEPHYIEKFDVKMEHTRLNGTGLGLNLNDLKNFKITDLKSFLSLFECIGGSAFDDKRYENELVIITNFYNSWLVSFNNSIANKDWAKTSDLTSEFFAHSNLMIQLAEKRLAEGWNKCSTRHFEGTVAAFKYFRDIIGQLLSGYMTTYFTSTGTTLKEFTNAGYKEKYGYWIIDSSPAQTFKLWRNSYNPNVGVSIPQFEIPQYVNDQVAAGKTINFEKYLGLLSTVLLVTKGSDSSSPPLVDQGYYGLNPNPTTTQNKTAGSGIMGWIITAIAVGVLINGVNKKNKVTPKSTKNVTTK